MRASLWRYSLTILGVLMVALSYEAKERQEAGRNFSFANANMENLPVVTFEASTDGVHWYAVGKANLSPTYIRITK